MASKTVTKSIAIAAATEDYERKKVDKMTLRSTAREDIPRLMGKS